jgi:hypothetical protein
MDLPNDEQDELALPRDRSPVSERANCMNSFSVTLQNILGVFVTNSPREVPAFLDAKHHDQVDAFTLALSKSALPSEIHVGTINGEAEPAHDNISHPSPGAS